MQCRWVRKYTNQHQLASRETHKVPPFVALCSEGLLEERRIDHYNTFPQANFSPGVSGRCGSVAQTEGNSGEDYTCTLLCKNMGNLGKVHLLYSLSRANLHHSAAGTRCTGGKEPLLARIVAKREVLVCDFQTKIQIQKTALQDRQQERFKIFRYCWGQTLPAIYALVRERNVPLEAPTSPGSRPT